MPDCAATALRYDAERQVWHERFELPAGRYEFKVALNDAWNENYGQGAVYGGANVSLVLEEETAVTFYYSHATNWVTTDQQDAILIAIGDFQSSLGCREDGQADCFRTWLQDTNLDGVYSFVTDELAAGRYSLRVASADGGPSACAGLVEFEIPEGGAQVDIRCDVASGVLERHEAR